jgi:uncharacterized protein YutE (UPF0331/DUF86 family)
MDSVEREFLAAERRNIEATLELLEDARAKPEPSKMELIAIGTLLQNIYTGLENVLRFVLQLREMKIAHSGSWHKDLIAVSRKTGIVSDEVAEGLMELLLFRHLHIHGYAFRIDRDRMRPLIESAPETVRRFFVEIGKLNLDL